MKEFRFALKQTVPIFFTYLFLGVAFGVLMSDAGFGAGFSAAAAVFIFAGSLQLVMVPLMASGASLLTIALTSLLINARHIFYGIGFIEKFRRMGARYPYMIFSLTDETYSILSSVRYPEGLDEDRCAFFIAMLNQSYWILGACAGSYLQFDMRGFEFSAVALFLVVVTDQWRQYKTKLPFLVAAACAVGFFLLLGKEYFLVPTLLASLAALLVLRGPIEKKEGLAYE